jgi:hypothetical protein
MPLGEGNPTAISANKTISNGYLSHHSEWFLLLVVLAIDDGTFEAILG